MSQHQMQATPPWHMWGNTQTVQLQANSVTPVSAASPQLARINYKRPDSWRFFMAATLLDVQGPVLAGSLVTVAFSVTLGVGRSQSTIPQFVFFEFDPAGGAPFYTLPALKWTNASLEPVRVGTTPPAFSTSRIDVIPADSIQCTAICTLQAGSAAAYRATLEVAAYFAPQTHVRPDWYTEVGHFNGNEDGGK